MFPSREKMSALHGFMLRTRIPYGMEARSSVKGSIAIRSTMSSFGRFVRRFIVKFVARV